MRTDYPDNLSFLRAGLAYRVALTMAKQLEKDTAPDKPLPSQDLGLELIEPTPETHPELVIHPILYGDKEL